MQGRSLAVLAMAAAVIGAVGCGHEAADAPPAETATAVFAVEGMTCDGCAAAIGRSLKQTPGVVKHTVSFIEARAHVTYDPTRTTPTELAGAIERAGYRAVAEAPAAPGSQDPPGA